MSNTRLQVSKVWSIHPNQTKAWSTLNSNCLLLIINISILFKEKMITRRFKVLYRIGPTQLHGTAAEPQGKKSKSKRIGGRASLKNRNNGRDVTSNVTVAGLDLPNSF